MTRGLDFAPARRADAATNPAPTRTRCTRLRRGTQTCCYQPKTSPTPVRSSPAHLARFATTALYPIGVVMQGDPDVLRLLNEQLTSELTAINQYFLHSKMQDNWGFTELAAHTRAESFDEMRHAEEITDRILLLDGLPNYQRIGSLRIGQTLREQFEADLAIEYDVLNRLKPGIVMCREKQDTTSAVLLEKIVADEEEHIDYLETQLELMDKLGEELYSAQCVSRPPT
ncbi:bacterioferritin BfrA [Mycobacterium tuberculosis]|nr:bacterioferritin BfrA [Mycobacterium tuberculosis]